MSLSHIPVVGRFAYRDAGATPAAGETIEFFCRSPAVVDGDTIALPRALRTTLTADGEVPGDFTLPTVGDGVYYIVLEDFEGGRGSYTIQVLTTDTEIDLATVAPVVPVEPMAAFVELGDFELLQEQVDDLATVVDGLDLFPGALNGAQWDTTTRLRVGALDYPTVGVVISSQSISFGDESGYSATLLGPAGILAGDTAIRLPAESGTLATLGDITDIAAPSRNTATAVTSSAGTLTLDYALGEYFTCALSENVTTLAFANLPGSGKGATIMLRLTQNASAKTFAWPASFKWAGGSAGVISTGAGAVDVLAMTTFDNGTTWEVTLAKAFA